MKLEDEKRLLEQIGLQFMRISKDNNVKTGKTFVTISHDMEFKTKEELDIEISRFMSKLLGSRLIAEKIREVQNEVDNLRRDVTDLKECKKYKIAYDLNYYMKHGQCNQQQ